jgi:hypothetical protein
MFNFLQDKNNRLNCQRIVQTQTGTLNKKEQGINTLKIAVP